MFYNYKLNDPNDNENSRNQNCEHFASEIRPLNFRWERMGVEFIIPEKDISETSKRSRMYCTLN